MSNRRSLEYYYVVLEADSDAPINKGEVIQLGENNELIDVLGNSTPIEVVRVDGTRVYLSQGHGVKLQKLAKE